MKKLLCILLACLCITPAFADDIDLSGMSYDELVRLKDRINLYMWLSDEWQEVKVPSGLWEIGVDIPAGHWTLTANPEASYVQIWYSDSLNESGKDINRYSKQYYSADIWGAEWSYFQEGQLSSIDIDMQEGFYLKIDHGYVIFTPYQGKPSFDFK